MPAADPGSTSSHAIAPCSTTRAVSWLKRAAGRRCARPVKQGFHPPRVFMAFVARLDRGGRQGNSRSVKTDFVCVDRQAALTGRARLATISPPAGRGVNPEVEQSSL